MTRLVKLTPGEYFHIYNRGTNKMEIFLDDYDYTRFQELLYIANSRKTIQYSDLKNLYPIWEQERGEALVDIGAYTLMPNHFHILIKSKNEKDSATFLQRLLISHSKYFNKKYERSGSLFQGKSKSKHVTGDVYLKYLFSYIHLNIVKLIQTNWKEVGIKNLNAAKELLLKYKYSSYIDNLGKNRPEGKILNRLEFPEYFSTPELFQKEIFEWLKYEKNDK